LDGHPAPRPRRLRGHPADQGPARPPGDPDHRRHLLRALRRRREGHGGRLRRLRDQALQSPGPPGQDPGAPRVRTPPRILVADDNPMNVDILRARLAAQGYDVLTARDGEEALAIARDAHPDLILLDVMMPKQDGLEVCRRLRSDPSFPFTPIILVTAKADPKDVVAGLEAGGDEYLTKPVDQTALVARVKSMLRIKELHDSVEALAAQRAEWNRTLEERVQAQVAQL